MTNKFEYTSNSKRNYDLPTRATKSSVGYDFHSPIDFTLKPKSYIQLTLGVKCRIKEEEFLLLVPRSSFGFGKHISLANTVGIIDEDYYNNSTNEGEIGVRLYNNSDSDTYSFKVNDKLIQGIFIKYDVIEDDNVTTKRIGGFGSTDTQ